MNRTQLYSCISNYIGGECKKRRLTQQIVAKHLGVSQAQVSLLFLAKRRVSVEILVALAGMFGVEPWLLFRDAMLAGKGKNNRDKKAR